LADAAREDLRRARTTARGADPVHLRAHGPDHRRRDRVLRDAGRRQRRGAGRADRVREAPRHRADDQAGAPGRVPALGVPARSRHGGLHRRPARAEDDARAAAAPHARPARERRRRRRGGGRAGGGRATGAVAQPRGGRARRRRRRAAAAQVTATGGLPGLNALTYHEIVRELFPRLSGGIRWGLERTRRLLAAVGDPHLSYRTLHVGGTNGKGSVAATLASVLQRTGAVVGLYTSPHLCTFRERI